MTASRRFPFPLPIALVAALPGTYLGAAAYLGLPHPELVPPLAALVYGIAIIGAAFVLSWAAEAAQVDISAGLALAVLALLAVLPEYAVDFVFSWQAGQIYAAEGTCPPDEGGTTACALALANMTGANRILVGVGWSCVNVASSALITEIVAPAERGRAIGFTDTISQASTIILPLSGGTIAAHLGLPALAVVALAVVFFV